MKKILHYFARRKMVERMDPNQTGFFEKRMMADHVQRYEFASDFMDGGVVLDIACGEGFGAEILSKKAAKIVAVDSAQIDKSIKNNKKINFVKSDAIEYLEKNKEKFDYIVCFETVEHIKEYEKFIQLLKNNLKVGGTLFVSTPNKKFTDSFFGEIFNPYHVKEFYTQELFDILGKIFKSKPKILRQRPVKKNNFLISTLLSFVDEKSKIVEDSKTITGVDNIYLLKK